jgi:hypothetical protein
LIIFIGIARLDVSLLAPIHSAADEHVDSARESSRIVILIAVNDV